MLMGVNQMAMQKQGGAKETTQTTLVVRRPFRLSNCNSPANAALFWKHMCMFALFSCGSFQMAARDVIFRIAGSRAGSLKGVTISV